LIELPRLKDRGNFARKDNNVNMAELRIYKTSEIILIWLHRNNLTQTWLADQFGITRQAISQKIKDNLFGPVDIYKLKTLGILEE
jgi:predicted XRE-type DNA-binding protein